MDTSSGDKIARLPTFDGLHENFQAWWTRFTAYATVHKFAEALVIGGELNLPANESDILDLKVTADQVKSAAKK